MLSLLFNKLIYQPLYNALVLLIDILPWHSAALAVVILTVFVKFALLPLAYKMAHTQKKMKEITPELEKIKEKHKDDRQKQALETMELYKKHNIKPFGSFLMLLLQLPVIIGLYWVFLKSGLPEINNSLLYSFVPIPNSVNMHIFNISMSDKSVILAFLVFTTQFLYSRSISRDMDFGSEEGTFKADFQKSLQMQMQYVLPIFIAFISYSLGAGIALYFISSNVFLMAQDYYLRKKGVK